MSKPNLTNAQINFFESEIRNEEHGGTSPATIGSAIDSLLQAPKNVIVAWCNDDTVPGESGSVMEFISSIKMLENTLGSDTTLSSLLPEM